MNILHKLFKDKLRIEGKDGKKNRNCKVTEDVEQEESFEELELLRWHWHICLCGWQWWWSYNW